MDTKENLLTVIQNQFPTMSKSHKTIAKYLTDHSEKAVFLTAAGIGKEVGVSESTVIRFASSLGYQGFSQLQKALEKFIQTKLEPVHKIKLSQETTSREELVRAVLQSDITKLKDTYERLDFNALDIAIQNILLAETVYLIGIRNCAPLAESLYFYLQMVCSNVVLLKSTNHNEIFEQMMRISEKDVMIGISFPRYSMRTLKAMEFANNRNAKIISITDSVYSPINLYSSCNLLAKSDLSSVLDSMVAPLSLINALVMALYMEKEEEVLKNMELVEELWKDYQVYAKDEINFFDPQKGTNLYE